MWRKNRLRKQVANSPGQQDSVSALQHEPIVLPSVQPFVPRPLGAPIALESTIESSHIERARDSNAVSGSSSYAETQAIDAASEPADTGHGANFQSSSSLFLKRHKKAKTFRVTGCPTPTTCKGAFNHNSCLANIGEYTFQNKRKL
jgi:hypothetical protein